MTCLCCLPLGIVAIVFAAQVDGAWRDGNVALARSRSRMAATWAWAGAILGALLTTAAFALGWISPPA